MALRWAVKKNVETTTEWKDVQSFIRYEEADNWTCEYCFANNLPRADFRIRRPKLGGMQCVIQRKVGTKIRWQDIRIFEDPDDALEWLEEYCDPHALDSGKYRIGWAEA